MNDVIVRLYIVESLIFHLNQKKKYSCGEKKKIPHESLMMMMMIIND